MGVFVAAAAARQPRPGAEILLAKKRAKPKCLPADCDPNACLLATPRNRRWLFSARRRAYPETLRVGRYLRDPDRHSFQIGCERGHLLSDNKAHPRGTAVRFLLYAGYHNLFPGTLPMSDEVAANIARVAVTGGFGKVGLDGIESTGQVGFGYHGMNSYLSIISSGGGSIRGSTC